MMRIFKIKKREKEDLAVDKITDQSVDKIIEIGSIKLSAPHQHRLDEHLKNFPDYSKNFARVSKVIVNRFGSSCTLVDVGANIGDSIALLRNEGIQNKIISFEGSQFFCNYLKRNLSQLGEVILFENYLSQEKKKESLELQIKDGTGELHLSEKNQMEMQTLDNLLFDNSLIINESIKILKIDADGYDFKILKGASTLINNQRPVIFFEYDPVLTGFNNEDIFNVFSYLKDHGYFSIFFYDNFGRFLLSTNLENNSQLRQLDRYIRNGKGAFPYYDILAIHRSENELNELIDQHEMQNH